MILYYGSNTIIKNIDIEKCKPHKDFGRGFYLTSIESQAATFARRIHERQGGIGKPTVSIFEFLPVESKNSTVLRFNKLDWDWAWFVLRNRYFRNIKETKYDIIIGPVGDDDMFRLFQLFVDDIISKEDVINKMKYKKLNDQYCFKSQGAISSLSYTNYKMV